MIEHTMYLEKGDAFEFRGKMYFVLIESDDCKDLTVFNESDKSIEAIGCNECVSVYPFNLDSFYNGIDKPSQLIEWGNK